LLEFGSECAQLRLEIHPEPGHALTQLGLEPGLVEVVELPEVGPVGQIHGVEPFDELIGNVVSKCVVELPGQLRGHRH
jgi:hypothetical protein